MKKKNFFSKVIMFSIVLIFSMITYITFSFSSSRLVFAYQPAAESHVYDLTLDASGKFKEVELNNLFNALVKGEQNYKGIVDKLTMNSYVSSDKFYQKQNVYVKLNVGQEDRVFIATCLTTNFSNQPILTLWLAESKNEEAVEFSNVSTDHDLTTKSFFKDNDFKNGTDDVYDYPAIVYGNSYARSYLVGSEYRTSDTTLSDGDGKSAQNKDWAAFIDKYKDYIEIPANVSLQQEQSTLDHGFYENSSVTNKTWMVKLSAAKCYFAWINDPIWLPSNYEVGQLTTQEKENSFSGPWKVSLKQYHENNSTNQMTLLRAAFFGNEQEDSIAGVRYIPYTPQSYLKGCPETSTNLYQKYAIRPALHLNLEKALLNALNTTVDKLIPQPTLDTETTTGNIVCEYPNASSDVVLSDFDFDKMNYSLYYSKDIESPDLGTQIQVGLDQYIMEDRENNQITFHTPASSEVGKYKLSVTPKDTYLWLETGTNENIDIFDIVVSVGTIQRVLKHADIETNYGDISEEVSFDNFDQNTMEYNVYKDEGLLHNKATYVEERGNSLHFKTNANTEIGKYSLKVKPKEKYFWQDDLSQDEYTLCTITVKEETIQLKTEANITGLVPSGTYNDEIMLQHYFDDIIDTDGIGENGKHSREFQKDWFKTKDNVQVSSIQYSEFGESYDWQDHIDPVTEINTYEYYVKVTCPNHTQRIFHVTYLVVQDIINVTFDSEKAQKVYANGSFDNEKIWEAITSITGMHKQEQPVNDLAEAKERLRKIVNFFLTDSSGNKVEEEKVGTFTIRHEFLTQTDSSRSDKDRDLDTGYGLVLNNNNYTITKALNKVQELTEFDFEGFVYGSSEITLPDASQLHGYEGTTAIIKYYSDALCTTELTEAQLKASEVGTYYAKVIIEDTDNYQRYESKVYSFEITPAENSWVEEFEYHDREFVYGNSFTMPDTPISVSGGKVTITYYTDVKCDEGSKIEYPEEFFNSKAANVGTYYVKVDVDATKNYKELSKTYSFKIVPADNQLQEEFNPSGWVYEADPSLPSVPSVADGTPKITYYTDADCLNMIDDPETYFKTAEVGTYYLKVTVEATDNYKAYESVFSFDISKAENRWLTSIPEDGISFQYNNAPEKIIPNIETASKANYTITYYSDISLNEKYKIDESTLRTSDVGTYYAKVTIEESKNYKTLEVILPIKITEIENSWITEFHRDDFAYGNPSVVTMPVPKYGKNNVIVTYYEDEQCIDPISEEELKTAKVGTYYAKVDVESSINYGNMSEVYSFKIVKAEQDGDYAIYANEFINHYERADFVYGQVATTPILPISRYGIPSISYYKDASYSELSKIENPDEYFNTADAGTYYVLVTVEATDDYIGLEERKEFHILKADNSWTTEFHMENFVYGNPNVPQMPSIAHGNDEDITVTYYSDESLSADSIVTDLSIANVGRYYAHVKAKGDTNYNDLEETYSFYITKNNENDWVDEFSCDNFTFEETPSVVTTPTSIYGTPEISYYTDASCEERYKITEEELKTADAGTYFAKVVVADTDNYNGFSKIYAFTIDPANNEWLIEFSRDNFYYGNPSSVTTPTTKYGGKITIRYYRNRECTQIISEEELKVAGVGTYYVKVSVAATKNHKAIEAIYQFEILQANDNMWLEEYHRSDFVYGTTPSIANIPIAKYGEALVSYYKDADCRIAIREEQFATAPIGTYYAKVEVPATSSYNGLSNVYEFHITKGTNRWTKEFSRNDFIYQNPSEVTMPVALHGTATIKYYRDERLTDEITEEELKTAPVGTYYVLAETVGNENYNGLTSIYRFNIMKAENSFITEYHRENYAVDKTQSIETQAVAKYGDVIVKYYTDADCSKEIKKENIDKVGTYYVKVIVEETNNYYGLEKVYKFSVLDKYIAFDMGIFVAIIGFELLVMLLLVVMIRARRNRYANRNH